MKKLLAITILALAPFIVGWTISWDPVTMYTDNTLIEATKTVTYDIRKDGVLIGNKVVGTSLVFTDIEHGSVRSFTAQTVLSTGETSVESPAYSWTVPLGVPGNPLNLRVAP